jgi:non-ribosomal peptide synthetase component E (peptide arylation enzyme)
MPDPDLGEQVCAYIKPVGGAKLSYEGIIEHMQKMEASRMHYPARVEFVKEIPLTAAGKADKKVLREDIKKKIKPAKEEI